MVLSTLPGVENSLRTVAAGPADRPMPSTIHCANPARWYGTAAATTISSGISVTRPSAAKPIERCISSMSVPCRQMRPGAERRHAAPTRSALPAMSRHLRRAQSRVDRRLCGYPWTAPVRGRCGYLPPLRAGVAPSSPVPSRATPSRDTP